MSDGYRIEKDSLGEVRVPTDALYGAQTQRAVENFPISGRRFGRGFIQALGLLKKAAALTNGELGNLERKIAEAIAVAAEEVAIGELDGEFVVDIYQTGSGTSTNMNANEVVARRADQILGEEGSVHPNDHVNFGQSSNDVIPSAIHIAARVAMERELIPALVHLRDALSEKAGAFDHVVKSGRTHLMDATPVRLGQQFGGYAHQLTKGIERVRRASEELAELALGGTAVGTGINTHPRFSKLVVRRLRGATNIKFAEALNHFEAQATRDCIVEASGELKTIAIAFTKIANDIRWLGSGPRCGLFELSLPATQPGSSIMPGKVNPVMCEAVMQVACQVVGNDIAITMGGAGGIGSLLELNVAMPMMAANFIDAITLLANVATTFDDNCLKGLQVNKAVATGMVEKSLMTITALAPEIGYDQAAKAAKAAFETGQTVREYVLQHQLVEKDRLDELLDARAMTEPA